MCVLTYTAYTENKRLQELRYNFKSIVPARPLRMANFLQFFPAFFIVPEEDGNDTVKL